MNKEDKKLLLKDLCGRLPYGVKCTTKSLWNGIYSIEGYKDDKFFLDCPVYDEGDDEWMIESIVPYLRPMYSMTNEERAERIGLLWEFEGHINEDVTYKYQDWLNAHHLDYRGLIPMGLALEAPKGMYDTWTPLRSGLKENKDGDIVGGLKL